MGLGVLFGREDNQELIAYTDMIMLEIQIIGEVLLVMCTHSMKEGIVSRSQKKYVVYLSNLKILEKKKKKKKHMQGRWRKKKTWSLWQLPRRVDDESIGKAWTFL